MRSTRTLMALLTVLGCASTPRTATTPATRASERPAPVTVASVGEVGRSSVGAFLPIETHHQMQWVVLAEADEQADASEGPIEVLDRAGAAVTRRSARVDALPEALRGLPGARVRVYGGHGERCVATLGPISVLGRVVVHFGVENRWQGQQDDGTQGPPMPDAEVAREAWAEGAKVYAARLEPGAGCRHLLWARLDSLPEVAVFDHAEAPADLATAAITRFRAQASWRRIEAEYRQSDSPRQGVGWDAHDGSPPEVTLWQAPDRRRYLHVTATTSDGGCGAFNGALSQVYEVTTGGGLTPLADEAEPFSFTPEGAVDLDGDGLPEFLVEGGLIQRRGNTLGFEERFRIPNHDCPC